jgi:hypothetical protein
MPTVISSVQSRTVDGKITSIDLTNDAELVAIALERRDGGPSIQVYRCADLSLQAEYAPNVVAGRGVAFVDDDAALMFVTHTSDGATLYLVDDGAPKKLGEYPARQAEQLIRDRTGARVGIVGDSFIVWSPAQRGVVAHVSGEAEEAGFLIHGSFASHGNRVFLYGKKAQKIVLHDLTKQEDVDEWHAPYEFGRFVTSSPSDRYIIAVGYNGQGVLLIDTKERRTLAETFFNDDSLFDMLPLFLHDESVLMTWAKNAWLFAPPAFEWAKGPPMSGGATSAACSAREAPVLAFGVDDSELRLVHFAPGNSAV